jgi:thiamine-monophosphate kinase
MRESELLDHIRERSAPLRGRGAIVVGPGDDCAVLSLPGLTLATVDHLVEGRHYDAALPIDLIARKAVARSVSDIAAMGGDPSCGLATGCLREGFKHANELFDRMAHWADEFNCPLAGGDIAFHDGPTVLTVTVMGTAHAARGPVERSTAREGDKVCVTGTLGNSLASGRHATFEPRTREGRTLCDLLGRKLTSMIDISDGLGRDAARIAKASAVRIEMESWRLPLSQAVTDWHRAASDGEDYELLFTISGDAPPPREACGTPISIIGRVTRGSGCAFIDESGTTHNAAEMGWDHGHAEGANP